MFTLVACVEKSSVTAKKVPVGFQAGNYRGALSAMDVRFMRQGQRAVASRLGHVLPSVWIKAYGCQQGIQAIK